MTHSRTARYVKVRAHVDEREPSLSLGVYPNGHGQAAVRLPDESEPLGWVSRAEGRNWYYTHQGKESVTFLGLTAAARALYNRVRLGI